jgi:hypothetical protein
MIKKILSLALALVLSLALAVPALASDEAEAEGAAWELYGLGLFLGTGTDDQGFPVFELTKAPTRAESVTMLVRLMGKTEAAEKGTWTTPFTDVPDWAAPYVGYAYENGLTNGRTATTFDPGTNVTAAEYLTFVLRALGYDSGSDFQWKTAWTLSDQLGFTDGTYNADTNKDFDRGDVALISAAALDAKEKAGDKTLRETLAAQGIQDKAAQCVWEEESVSQNANNHWFTFTATQDSPQTYIKFVVNSATVNGVSCQIKQLSTATLVKNLEKSSANKNIGASFGDAFCLVRLTYDGTKVQEAATQTCTDPDTGETFPVYEYKLKATGTLKGGTQVQELILLRYYANGTDETLLKLF